MSDLASVPWPYPAVIAHRGGGRLAPENTLAALRFGHDYGFIMSEFDVKLSKDNVLIILHDDDVDRTSNGRGPAKDLSLNELVALDFGGWHSADYAGEPMATLGQFARYICENRLLCNIEIKPCPGRETETGHAVAHAVRELWRDAAIPPLISSFSQDSLRAMQQSAPELPRAFLTDILPDDFTQILQTLGCVAINLDQQHLDQRTIERIHAAGYKVCAWTVNDYRRAKDLLGWGCDAIFTDELARIPADFGNF